MEKALLIVPLSYGYIHSRDALPAMEERALRMTVVHYFTHSSEERRIVMSFTVGCPKEISKKIEYLLNLGVPIEHIIASSVSLKNMITEGETIRDVAVAAGLNVGDVVLIAHEDCAARARYVFSKLFPESVILVEEITGKFEKDIPYRFMRNQTMHRVLNLIYYWGMRILGLERMKQYGHPEHNK